MSDVSLSHDLVLEGLEPGVAGSVAGTCCEVIGHKHLWSAIALSISCAFQEALQAQRAEISTLRDLGQCWSNRSAGSWAEDGPQARFTVKEASSREQWETEGTPASPQCHRLCLPLLRSCWCTRWSEVSGRRLLGQHLQSLRRSTVHVLLLYRTLSHLGVFFMSHRSRSLEVCLHN